MDSKQIVNITVALLICLFLYWLAGSVKDTFNAKSKTDTVFVYDHTIHTFKDSTPKTKPQINNSYYNSYITTGVVKVDIDSVIKDYFAKKFYNDTVSNDSVDVYLKETIFKNELLSRKVAYKIKFPTQKVITTVLPEKRYFYVGLGAGVGKLPYLSVNGMIDFKPVTVMAGYDFTNKAVQVGAYKRFSFGKAR